MLISDKHFFLTASGELQELVKPLKEYGIDYFTYNKHFTDGSRIRLTTHPHQLKAFLENKYYLTGNIDANPQLYLNQAALFSTLQNQHIVEWVRANFRIYHGIYILRKSELFTEFFGFATSINNPQIINFYLNNLDFLQKFCDLFMEQGKALITQAEQNKLYHNHNETCGINLYKPENLEAQTDTIQFSDQFSPRKLDIIHWLLQGYRAKEIAQKLNISPRTVEEHIADLKTKLDARNIMELIARLKSYF